MILPIRSSAIDGMILPIRSSAHDFWRFFLVDTKTDNYESVPWTTFTVSPTKTSAYTSLQNLVKNIVTSTPEEVLNNLACFHIMFKSLKGSVNDYKTTKITYNQFLQELKTGWVVIGLNPAFFTTNSLRRGSVSDQFVNGVPAKIIKYSGRWRWNALDAYIDHTVLFELQLQTIQPPKYKSWVLSS